MVSVVPLYFIPEMLHYFYSLATSMKLICIKSAACDTPDHP